ncbi:MAG TPA: DUF4389 domain-containing protein [Gaiellaceae bacterium]
MAVSPSVRPIRLVVRDDDLRRSRLTVFFRLFLAIPLFIWLLLWGIAAYVVAFVLWLAVLINAEAPRGLHDFVAAYLRYSVHVGAYVFLAADPYPWFRSGVDYPVDLEIDPPQRQSRWTGFFRLFLALPALLLAAALGGSIGNGPPGGGYGSQDSDWSVGFTLFLPAAGAAAVAAFLVWFAALVQGRAPRGLRDLTGYAIGYSAQATGYLLLLTGRYPSSDTALAEPYADLPEHPVRIAVDDELRRSRLTILFRLLLAIPHFVWITLWSLFVPFAALAAWVVALVAGRVPSALHRFLAAYVRYATHLFAYVYVVGSKFPGFTGRQGSYGIDVLIDGPRRQSRWKTLFRLFLALPAFFVASALGSVLFVVALFGWWFALIMGRMPEGLRNLGASCLRYSAQTYAYLLLLTDRYPYASPVLAGRQPMAEPLSVPLPEPVPGDAS